mgnify:CR=1 FL=1
MNQESVTCMNAEEKHNIKNECSDEIKNGEKNSTDSAADIPSNRNEQDTIIVSSRLAYLESLKSKILVTSD